MNSDKSTELVTACVGGDRKAQNTLYMKLKPILANVCRPLCRTKEDAEDVVAESMAKVFMNLGSYHGTSMAELVAWAKTIAKRRAVDNIHFEMADKRRGFKVGYSEIHGQDPSTKNTASPDKELILAMMVTMPKKPRLVFMMREIEGYTYDELTVILGMKMNALKTNYHRARKWLMARIEADLKKADTKR